MPGLPREAIEVVWIAAGCGLDDAAVYAATFLCVQEAESAMDVCLSGVLRYAALMTQMFLAAVFLWVRFYRVVKWTFSGGLKYAPECVRATVYTTASLGVRAAELAFDVCRIAAVDSFVGIEFNAAVICVPGLPWEQWTLVE